MEAEEVARRSGNGPIRLRLWGRPQEPLGAACGFEGPASADVAPSPLVELAAAMLRCQGSGVGCYTREGCQAIVVANQPRAALEVDLLPVAA